MYALRCLEIINERRAVTTMVRGVKEDSVEWPRVLDECASSHATQFQHDTRRPPHPEHAAHVPVPHYHQSPLQTLYELLYTSINYHVNNIDSKTTGIQFNYRRIIVSTKVYD